MRCENQVAWKGISNNIISHVISVSPCHVLLYIVSLIHKGLQSKAFFFLPLGAERCFKPHRNRAQGFFPFYWQIPFFSCLCIFPSFSQTAAEPYFHFSLPGQTPQSFHNGFTRKAPKAAAPVAGCRAQFTPAATSAKATAACSKAKTFWCEQS